LYRFPAATAGARPPWRGTLAALLAFAVPAVLVAAGPLPALTRLDEAVSAAVRAAPPPALDTLAFAVTLLGDFALTVSLMTALVLMLLGAGRWALALHAAWLFFLTKLAVAGTKIALARPRPLALYEGGDSYAFPSGHATSGAVLLGVVCALFLARYRRAGAGCRVPGTARDVGTVRPETVPCADTGGAGRADRFDHRFSGVGIVAAFALPAVLIALSRVRLGAHWPSDVAAGLALGTALVLPFVWHARRSLAATSAPSVTPAALVRPEALPWLALVLLVTGYLLYATVAWPSESARYGTGARAAEVRAP